ncbi:hypothetical protein ACRAWF_36285 [Streptomyces sp. L7]
MTGGASFGMLAAHLLAAVLCGLWLAPRRTRRVPRPCGRRRHGWPNPCGCCWRCRYRPRRPSTRRRRTLPYRSSLARLPSLPYARSPPGGPPTGLAVV